MTIPIASATRLQIRQTIGDNCGIVIASEAGATGSTTTLSDTYALAKGGQDEYLGWQIQVNTAGTATIASKRFVTASSASVLTLNSALAATTVSGDDYELWKPPYTIEQINNLITQAERDINTQVFVDKIDETTFIETGRSRYSIPSGFLGIHTVEFAESIAEYETIEDCADVWNESVDSDVTASIDSNLRDGETWLKLVVAVGASANDILATEKITSLDLRDCTEVEISVFSTATLAAGDVQLLLDDTASCASPLETLNIPATTAKTFTRHIISLANPQSDNAIISVGIKMVTDTTFTLYVRNIKAVRANSRRWKKLLPDYWELDRGSTNYLQIENILRNDTLLKIKGYSAITAMSADSSTSEVDPQYLVDRISADILLSQAPTDTERARGNMLADRAERKKRAIRTPIYAGTRWL